LDGGRWVIKSPIYSLIDAATNNRLPNITIVPELRNLLKQRIERYQSGNDAFALFQEREWPALQKFIHDATEPPVLINTPDQAIAWASNNFQVLTNGKLRAVSQFIAKTPTTVKEMVDEFFRDGNSQDKATVAKSLYNSLGNKSVQNELFDLAKNPYEKTRIIAVLSYGIDWPKVEKNPADLTTLVTWWIGLNPDTREAVLKGNYIKTVNLELKEAGAF
jgi:hypothetical protein